MAGDPMRVSRLAGYVAGVRVRYRGARKRVEAAFLDEVCQTSGYHRMV